MAQQAFLGVFQQDEREAPAVWAQVKAAVTGYAASDTVKAGRVKNMTGWLTDGYYAQQHGDQPDNAQTPEERERQRNRERYGSPKAVNS